MKHIAILASFFLIGCGELEKCLMEGKECQGNTEVETESTPEAQAQDIELPVIEEREEPVIVEKVSKIIPIVEVARVSPAKAWEDYHELEAAAFAFFDEPREIEEFIIYHIGGGQIEIEINNEFFFRVIPDDTGLVDVTRTLRHVGLVHTIRIDTYLPVYLDSSVK